DPSAPEVIDVVGIPVDRVGDRTLPLAPGAYPQQSPPPPAPSPPPPAPQQQPPQAQSRNAPTLQSPLPPGLPMRGASQPADRTDVPNPAIFGRGSPAIPRAPAPPRELGMMMISEPAESLSLPPGLHGQPPPRDELPRTLVDARIAFTHLARELGTEYR